VTSVQAIEPAALARRLACRRIAASGVSVNHAGLAGEKLPLAAASADSGLSTFTLCTVGDAAQTLSELRRVIRPGGALHFLEHGLAPDPRVASWQRRLDPLQRRLAGGCHLTRDIPALIAAAGFELERLEQRYAAGPKPWSWFSLGIARNPS
jgi:SAM-dependent methyltransferase